MTVEVITGDKVWAIAEGDDGVTHAVHIDKNYDRYRVIWGCMGRSTALESVQTFVRPAGTPVTCLRCLARGLP